MTSSRLAQQLAALRVQLALDPQNRVIRVQIAATRRVQDRLAAAPDAEALPELLAKLARGDVTTDHVGSAIRRDLAVAGQVAQALTIQESQVGDIAVGAIVAGNIYHIYYGGKSDE